MSPSSTGAKSDLARWFNDQRLGGVLNHEARGHMPADLHRYLYASCYAQLFGSSPALADFPRRLLPEHENAVRAANGSSDFADRFRVQCRHAPASTVVSHISKDDHYYIHYDPHQCRSLTVREAARLQTFPDNYFFEGNRTEQYVQVGNAVPPLLAHQIANAVSQLLEQCARHMKSDRSDPQELFWNLSDVLTPEQRSRCMSRIRSRDTKPEMLVRSLVHALGYRFRLQRRDLPGRPDLVFPRLRKIIFVHGCFWHQHKCRFGRVAPATNARFWAEKRSGTVARDRRARRALAKLGWSVLVIWECETKAGLAKLTTKLARFLKPNHRPRNLRRT
jgi:DNA mismatch endonuclease Vsr